MKRTEWVLPPDWIGVQMLFRKHEGKMLLHLCGWSAAFVVLWLQLELAWNVNSIPAFCILITNEAAYKKKYSVQLVNGPFLKC